MNMEEITKLETELKSQLDEFSKIAAKHLEQTQKVIESDTKNLIDIYSNEIKNLGIISATVAPFSLALLTTNDLDVHIPFLIIGFALLIFNIILTQSFLYFQSKDYDRRVARAQLKWFFAQGDLSEINDSTKTTSERASKNFDFYKNISESEQLLGISKYDLTSSKSRYTLRRYRSVSMIFFIVGTIYIILSVSILPLLGLFM